MYNNLLKKRLVIGICALIVILCFPIPSIGDALNNAKANKESIHNRFYLDKEENSGKQIFDVSESISSSIKNNLYGVFFTNNDTGTIVGDDGLILHTVDGGETWLRKFPIKGLQTFILNSRLFEVSFFNEDVGMAVGWHGTVIYTNNGGERWNIAKTGIMVAFFGAQMLTSNIGFSAGVNTIFQPLIYRTDDCWESFDIIIFYPEYGGFDYEADLTDIYFIDTSTGFTTARVFNGEGAICRSNDSGYTWDTIYWANYCLNEITFPSDSIGYAVGDIGQIVKTIDSGENWSLLNSGTIKDLNSVSFPTKEIGCVVGSNGVILRTENGGSYWISQNSGTTENLNKVQFLDSEIGFAVGDSGTILHTEDGGDSWQTITRNLNRQIDFQHDFKFLRFNFYKILSSLFLNLFSKFENWN